MLTEQLSKQSRYKHIAVVIVNVLSYNSFRTDELIINVIIHISQQMHCFYIKS